MDPHKEEIVYDEYDYPSPRSIDSNEGGSKMEAGDQTIVSFSDRICLENVAGDKVCELGKSGIDDGDHHQSEGCINKSEEKEIGKSVPVAALGGDDLESILRQKALENLRQDAPNSSKEQYGGENLQGANGAPVASTDINEVETDESTTEAGVPRARVFLLGENRWEDSSRLSGGSKRTAKNTNINSATNCLTCRGEGRLLCVECDGTGEPNIEPQFIEWVDEGDAKCPYCEGLGYTICDLCQGKTTT